MFMSYTTSLMDDEQLYALGKIRKLLSEMDDIASERADNIPSLRGCGILGIAVSDDEYSKEWRIKSEEASDLMKKLGLTRFSI